MINGIVNIYKEVGYTSFDVVAKLRRILKQKKIGHTGTLDPLAEGVLPVCLGNGTKLCDTLTDRTKEYEAVMLLGVETDTEDTSGTIIAKQTVSLSEEEVVNAVKSFEGIYNQIPPMYSALKVNGKKLYELAREGKVIERKPRQVEIYNIEIKEIKLPYVKMLINCSKGTYIRSLCRDIGVKLGTGACMDKLIRTRVGAFKLEDSLKINDVETLIKNSHFLDNVISVEDALDEYETINVLAEYKTKIDNGNPLPLNAFECEITPKDGEIYKVRNCENLFFALYKFEEDRNILMPEKVFPL